MASHHQDMQKGQAERLMPMIVEVMADGQAELDDLDCIGVGIGPGNFTGTRISVSAARGMALALKIPAVGVSILDALAYGTDGPALACMDARRGQGYFQRFGFGDPEPFVSDIEDLDSVPGLVCLGNIASDVATRLGAQHVPAVYAPASAIARIATDRYEYTKARPAPLYLRAADAAPPRERPPAILS